MKPAGFDWKTTTAMIGAFAAKELFVAQLGIAYSLEDADGGLDSLRSELRRDHTPLRAFCVMLFCLISAPCVVTVAATRRETGSWKWAALQLVELTVLAWVVAALVYQVGTLAGVGT